MFHFFGIYAQFKIPIKDKKVSNCQPCRIWKETHKNVGKIINNLTSEWKKLRQVVEWAWFLFDLERKRFEKI